MLVSYANNDIFTALQRLEAPTFWRSVGIFGVLATINVLHFMLSFYVQQRVVLQWRVWLNDHIVGDWLDGAAYHRGRFTTSPVDNPDQRIQEDIESMSVVSVALAVGALTAMVSLP